MIGKYFDSLGLPHSASEEEVRKRYRELVKLVHPDVNNSEDAHQQFVSLTEAYNALLLYFEQGQPTIDIAFEEVVEAESSAEDEWVAYRKHAEEQYKIRKEKERIEHQNWLQLLQKGWRLRHYQIAVLVVTLVLFATIVDWFLPFREIPEVAQAYSLKIFNSLPPNKVSLLQTRSGLDLWLANFNPSYFKEQPFFTLKSTYILHQPVSAKFHISNFLCEIPIHFTVYWAQLILLPILVLPIIGFFYKRQDAMYIFFHFFSRFVAFPLVLLMLLTDNRWLHLFTLGYY